MKVIKYISILLIVTLIAATATAQEKKLRRADESFEAEEYYKAMEEYTAILKKIKNKNDKIEISFDGVGTKTLLLSHAKLERLD